MKHKQQRATAVKKPKSPAELAVSQLETYVSTPRMAARIRAHELWPAYLEVFGNNAPSARRERARIVALMRADLGWYSCQYMWRCASYAIRGHSARHASLANRMYKLLLNLPTRELQAIAQKIEKELLTRNWR